MEYSIYQAKARLSEIVRLVKARRRVIISERGVPVAEVIPYTQKKNEKLADRISKLIAAGAILKNKKPFHAEMLANSPGAVDRFLKEDRE